MNQYIIWHDLLLFRGALSKNISEHKHPVVQIIISKEKPFLHKNALGEWEERRSLIVAPHQKHECDASNISILTLTIDPESTFGEMLMANQLKEELIRSLTNEELQHFDFNRLDNMLENEDFESIYLYCKEQFGVGEQTILNPKDERVDLIKQYIKDHLDRIITTRELCDLTFLSESRLLHLFKEQMGLPIRNYILWVRLKEAISLILKGDQNLTQIAYNAGFSDSSHMTKTFTNVLGINPAEIIKNSKFIQVLTPEHQ